MHYSLELQDLVQWGKKEIIIKCHLLTHANATFYIFLNGSKFIKEYIKIKYHNGLNIRKKKCIDLTWHDNQEVIFRKKNLLKTKTIATTSRLLELA